MSEPDPPPIEEQGKLNPCPPKDEDDQMSADRPKSQELTMFSPYNSLKNSERAFQGSDEPRQGEAITFREADDSKPGTARVIFRMIRDSFISQPTQAPSQDVPSKGQTKQREIRDKSPTPSVSSTMASFGPGAGRGQSACGRGSVDTTQKSTSSTGEKQSKVLVNPARGGASNIQNPPKTARVNPPPQPPKVKPPTVYHKPPPSRQPQPGVAVWKTDSDGVAFSGPDVQLSLSSYSQPRRNLSGRVQNQNGSRPPQQVGKPQVLKRFGEIENDQEISSDLRKYWMPDKACKECSDCTVKFNLFIRRHHCRMCGRIFCNSCCSLTIPGAMLRPDLQGNLRVCKNCKNLFREFHASKPAVDSPLLQSSSEPPGPDSSPLSPRHSISVTPVKSQVTLGDPLTQSSLPGSSGDVSVMRSGSGTYNRVIATSRPVSVLSPHKSWDDASGRSQELMDLSPSRSNVLEFDIPSYGSKRRVGMPGLTGFDSLTVGQREEMLLDLDQDEVEFIVSGVWLKLINPESGLPRQNHRYRLRTFANTYSAHALVEWLVTNGHVRSREVALLIGQALVDTKRLKIVSSFDSEFRDDTNLFLELTEAVDLEPEELKGPLVTDAPKWFQRLRDDRDEFENTLGDKQSPATNKEFVYVPPAESEDPDPRLIISSVRMKDVTKRSSRPELSQSSNSLLRAELDQEEYIVIDRERQAEVDTSSTLPKRPLSMELPQADRSGSRVSMSPQGLVSSTQGSSSLRKKLSTSGNRQGSFSVINNEDIVHALPVDGLSSATEAAKEFSKETSMDTISNEKARVRFQQEHLNHFNSLMVQLMMSLGLDLVWLDVIKPLVMEASRTVRTDTFTDDMMDINQYIKIKKIPRGKKANCALVYGVVCTKNVTHKKMYKSIKNPKILLLKCAFDFQRKESQLSSFDTLQLQEEKYLKNLVVKVNAIKPNLILVQKSVSRLALEMLYDLGIVVVLNVKPSVMNRVARSTKGQILHSLDQLFFGNSSIFGTCGHFYIRNFSLPDGDKKTLMYFDQCPPHLGCVITLQGGSMKELKKVKRVTQFGLHVAYNSLLETSFLVDEFAWPRSTEDNLHALISAEDYSSTCSTPELPLYPSLGYPLDALTRSELKRKLEALKFVEVDDSEGEDLDDKNELVDITGCFSASAVSSQSQDQIMKLETEASENKNTPPEVSSELARLSNNIEISERGLPPLEEKDEEGLDSIPVDSQLPEGAGDGLSVTRSALSLTQEDDPGLVLKITENAETEVVTRRPLVARKMNNKFLNKLAEKEFRLAYQNQVLSISPHVHFKAPYLQTPQGRSADARQYLPKIVYWSYLFKPNNLLKQTQKHRSSLDRSTPMEMGLTKSTVDSTVGMESGLNQESKTDLVYGSPELTSPQPSYKSVMTHPFTSSIFLLQASTNEMKAALADFRCRAGYVDESNTFFFRAAEKASDYQMHLDNVFRDSKEFELAAAALEEPPAESERESSLAGSGSSEVKSKRNWWEKKLSRSPEPPSVKEVRKDEKKKQGDPFAKLMPSRGGRKSSQSKQTGGTDSTVTIASKDVPLVSANDAVMPKDASESAGVVSDFDQNDSKNAPLVSDGDIVVSKNIHPVTQNITVVSTDEDGVATDVVKLHTGDSDNDEDLGLVETFPLTRSGSIHKSRDSGGAKISEKFGTLDDFDRSRRTKGESEEDNLDHMDMNYESWLAADEQVDCFDPTNHQGISILFSNTAHDGQKHQVPCVPPCVIPMFYYGRNDISLGEFLQRYCFRPFYRCQTCGVDMVEHKRHVIHASSAIHISMQQLESALPGDDDAIYTWLACKYCDQCTPYTLMSKNGLLFSFAKFLELKFHCDFYMTRYHGDDSTVCSHCLHNDYVQYFCHKNKIAAFQPSKIELLEVLVPPRSIDISTPRYKYHLEFKSEIKHTQRIVEGVFYRIGQKLEKYRLEPVASTIDDHIANSKAERDALRSKVKHLKDLVVSGGFQSVAEAEKAKYFQSALEEEEEEVICSLQDGIADLKRCVSDVVDCWNINFEDLDARVREYRRKLRERDSAQAESTRDNSSTPVSSTATAASSSTVSTQPRLIPGTEEGSRTSSTHSPSATPPDSSHSSPPESVDSRRLQNSAYSSSNTIATQQQQEISSSQKLSAAPSAQREKTHTRNFSEGNILQTSGEKVHKRQSSDSAAIQSEGENSRELSETKSGYYGSEATFSSTDLLSGTSVGASVDELVGDEVVNSPEGQRAMGEEVNNDQETAAENREGHVTQSEMSEANGEPTPKQTQPLDVPVVTETKGGGQKEGEMQTDNAGGILARFRGKEPQDARDDPDKYYLLDPYTLTKYSPKIGGSFSTVQQPSNQQDVTNSKPANKRHSMVPRRTAHMQGAMDSHSEGAKASEKRLSKEKEKVGVLSRPFVRLIPPFPNSEHHTMHSIITVPIGIYEKEPTSIIAFALSSREYSRKLALVQAAKMGGASTRVVEAKPAPASSPNLKLKRQSSEVEKLPSAASGTTLKTNFKAVLNELKKKGSSISLFSGSTSVSTTTNSSDVFDQLQTRSEFSSSYVGKSHEPDGTQSSRLSDPLSDGAGLASAAGGVGGADEMDSGKLPPHVSLEFTSPDKSSSFFCKVYYAEEFRQLRELIFSSGEERFIRSLARCIKYDAKGGKSRSAFCKVADDRFIMKQVKSIEISSFELFAPHYLQHVTKALEEKRPLMFAKTLGAYSIGFRNTKTGNSKRLDVLVMENLLYGHNTSKVFDLKGSMRSRYIDPSKESSGDVLLDENYLNFICYNPVYVHPHSKCVLMQAILADTEFLAQNGIMDYSLLTCIDESTGELVVGIIDYVRTFTLDKRLEMYLKKTAGKGLPTILSPELYRKRFYDAMDRYFTVVPDKWTGLGADVKFL